MKTKVKKPTIITDTFEQVAETWTGAVKQIPKAVVQVLNPISGLPESHGAQQDEGVQKAKREFEDKTDNHTPLDYEKLQGQYDVQDKQKQDALRQRLFKLVKEGEENAFEMKKKKEEDVKYQEEKENQEKDKRVDEKRRKDSDATLPRGKQRRGFVSRRKKTQDQHQEYKPSVGHG